MWHYTDGTTTHGPIDEATLRDLFRSGTIGRQTLVWREGMVEWRPYGDILSDSPGPGSTSAGQSSGGDDGRILTKVAAILMIVNASLMALSQLALLFFFFGAASLVELLARRGVIDSEFIERINKGNLLVSGAIGVCFNVVCLGFSIAVIVGALKMFRLTSYRWALAAAIMSPLCSLSPSWCCCPIGLGVGIFALIALLQSKVKSIF